MLHERIDQEIHDAAVNDDRFALETLRLIKAEFLKYKASKEALKTPICDSVEITIMQKMVKQRKESAEIYRQGGRADLAEKEDAEASFIGRFLPAPVTDEMLNAAVNQAFFDGIMPVKKNMGLIIKTVKEKYPTADGKTLAAIVSAKLT